MSRKLRIEYNGAFHHVTARGYGKRILFHCKEDFERFLEDLILVFEAYSLPIHAYCIMTNHLHLLTESPNANLQKAMQRLFTRYASYYKWKYGHENKVFERRYGAILVDTENYGLDLTKYIHLNPVGVLVGRAEDWEYSSYQYYLGKDNPPVFLQTDLLLKRFDLNHNSAKRKLIQFTNQEESSIWLPQNFVIGKSILGSLDFFERIEQFIVDKDHPEYLKLVAMNENRKLDRIYDFIQELTVDNFTKECCFIYALKNKTSLTNLEILNQVPCTISSSTVSTRTHNLKLKAERSTELASILQKIDNL